MSNLSSTRRFRLCTTGLVLALTGGCGALGPTATPQPSFYSLDRVRIETRERVHVPAAASVPAPTLIVNPPQAAAGFDSQRIIYTREAHRLQYFAHNEWVDTPARMLAPLIVAAVEMSGTFRAVVLTPSAAAGDLRLDTEIVRLQHDFAGQPSRVRFTLRAYLVDNTTRRVLAWREFDETVAATSEDAYGGVIAANRAVQTVLDQLGSFCTEASRQWRIPATDVPKRTDAN
jgi:cholesterol transport system auxiliary component